MENNNKKISALREGICKLECHLDNVWKDLELNHFQNKMQEFRAYDYYKTILMTIDILGGDHQRNENGRHKIFIAGVTDDTEVDHNKD